MHQRKKGEHGCRALCGEGCPCNTGNPHFQPDHEENIQKNITYGGADEEIQRRTAVPQRGEDAVADIIKIQEQKPIDIDMQIEFGIGENIGRGTTLTAMQAQKMVQIAVLSALYFFAPNRRETTTAQPILLPTATAMKIIVMGWDAPTAASAASPMNCPAMMLSAI